MTGVQTCALPIWGSGRFRAFRLAEATDVRGRGGRCRFRGPGLRSARLVRRGRLSGLFAGNVRAASLFGPEFFGEGSSGGGSKSGICVRSASPKTVFARNGSPPILRRQNVRKRFLPAVLSLRRCILARCAADGYGRMFCRRCRKKPSLAFLVCRRSFPPVAGKESFRSGSRIVGGRPVFRGVARRSRFGMKPGTVLSFAGLCGGRTANASDAVAMGKSGTAGRKMAAVKRQDMYARGPCRRTQKLSE